MALITGGQTCSICGGPVPGGGPMRAWPHFIRDRADPLWPYSDSVMHPACFDSWPPRAEFLRRLNGVGPLDFPGGAGHSCPSPAGGQRT